MIYVPVHPGIRVLRTAPGESTGAWHAALGAFEPASAELLKSDGNTHVFRTRLLERDVVLKAWSLTRFTDRLKAAFGTSRAGRHWAGAERLKALGVATATPYALLAEYRGPHPAYWLAMQALAGPTVLDALAGRAPQMDLEALGRALGDQLAALARSGWFNRDHKPSNLIVTGAPATVAVIDCVAIRRGPAAVGLARMFASLLIEPTGVGHPPPNTFVHAVRDRLTALGLDGAGALERARAIQASHGDPTPRISPLNPR